jgi:hypothetical protein
MDVKALCRHWVHSHEEDSDTEMVFRPASYKFPPARGRKGFELKPDGTLIDHGIGPTDRRTKSKGKWKLEGEELRVGERAMKIVGIDRQRLVVRKP